MNLAASIAGVSEAYGAGGSSRGNDFCLTHCRVRMIDRELNRAYERLERL
jgi:hypothetical protein